MESLDEVQGAKAGQAGPRAGWGGRERTRDPEDCQVWHLQEFGVDFLGVSKVNSSPPCLQAAAGALKVAKVHQTQGSFPSGRVSEVFFE